jgi:hypothetical protein
MPDRSAAIDQVRQLVLLSLFNDSANERGNAHRLAHKLIVRHEITQGELLGAAAARTWDVEDFMRMADRGKDMIASARAVLADPEVQKTVGALRDIGSGIAKGIGALRRRRAGA